MTVRAIITQGIGPGGSVLYALTGGLDLGAVPEVPRTGVATQSRDLPQENARRAGTPSSIRSNVQGSGVRRN